MYVYDILTGDSVKAFKGYMLDVRSFTFSEDGKMLITASADGKMIMWDYDKVDTLIIIQSSALLHMCTINNNLLLGSSGALDSNNIQIRDFISGKTIRQASTTGQVYGLALSKDNNLFAVAAVGYSPSNFYNVELWDFNTFKKITRLGTHDADISDLSFSPDWKYLASAANDGTVKVWDVNSKTLVKTFVHDSSHSDFLQIKFSPSGNYLITSGGGGFTTKIWDFKTFTPLYQYNTPYGATCGLDVSKDSSFIAIGGGYSLYMLNAHWTPTGIKDSIPNIIQNLYPNPSNNQITIPLETTMKANSINFCDYSGRLIKKINSIQPYLNQINVNISDLPTGIYMANVLYQTKTVSFKFEKER